MNYRIQLLPARVQMAMIPFHPVIYILASLQRLVDTDLTLNESALRLITLAET